MKEDVMKEDVIKKFGDKIIVKYKGKNHVAIYLGRHGVYTSYLAIKNDNYERGFTVKYIDDSNILDYDENKFNIENGFVLQKN